jgi:hypothetical protein
VCKGARPLGRQQGESYARAISEWREADSLWQRRASVVAFADLARKGDQNFPGYTEMVLDNCSHLLGSQERFVQTQAALANTSLASPLGVGTLFPESRC